MSPSLQSEVIQALAQASGMVDKLETRVEKSLGKLETAHAEVTKSHGDRLLAIEKWQYKILGAWAVLAFVILLGGGIATEIIVEQIKTTAIQLRGGGKI